MKFSFFKALAAALFAGGSKPPTAADLALAHRGLKEKPELQHMAREHGNQRRIDAWMRGVQDGYDHKRQLVKGGKGRNTLAGIPA